jgi:hypothetical protein
MTKLTFPTHIHSSLSCRPDVLRPFSYGLLILLTLHESYDPCPYYSSCSEVHTFSSTLDLIQRHFYPSETKAQKVNFETENSFGLKDGASVTSRKDSSFRQHVQLGTTLAVTASNRRILPW